jgi:hypothetical protein
MGAGARAIAGMVPPESLKTYAQLYGHEVRYFLSLAGSLDSVLRWGDTWLSNRQEVRRTSSTTTISLFMLPWDRTGAVRRHRIVLGAVACCVGLLHGRWLPRAFAVFPTRVADVSPVRNAQHAYN